MTTPTLRSEELRANRARSAEIREADARIERVLSSFEAPDRAVLQLYCAGTSMFEVNGVLCAAQKLCRQRGLLTSPMVFLQQLIKDFETRYSSQYPEQS